MTRIVASCRGLAALSLCLALAVAQTDQREVNVGMRARIEQLVLPGTKLVVKPVDDPKAAILLRILATWPHGSEFRYDLEYVGYVAGKHDLCDWLVRADGSPADNLPKVEVQITSVLSPLNIEPHTPDPVEPPKLGGYGTLLTVAIVLWVVGLIAIVFVGRRRAAAAAMGSRPATLAERLRPMVESAMQGQLDPAGRAELERLLLAHWRERIGLDTQRTAQAVATLRAHPEAGGLLRQLEDWLHRPEPPKDIDVSALLAPYRDVRDPDAEGRA